MGKNLFLLSLILMSFFTSLKAQEEVYDSVSDENLKTVVLYSITGQSNFYERYLNPPIAGLNNPDHQLFLEFDDLSAGYSQFKVRIRHCDMEWKPSRLIEMEYLQGINEFYIDDYQVSQNTKVPYYHYRFAVPKPKISGNYLLQVFKNDNLAIEKKFWIYESLADIRFEAQNARDPELWKTHQEISLKMDLGNLRLSDPFRELKVLIRMNQYLTKEIDPRDLKSFGPNKFTIQNFDDKYLFPAGNEFRYLDISSTFTKGQNVGEIELGRLNTVYTYTQNSRHHSNYVDAYDNDGGFIINNLDVPGDPDVNADYVEVVFTLFPPDENLEPYLLGKFTDWQPLEMEYDAAENLYYSQVLLKNGVYDFAFGIESGPAPAGPDLSYLERNFYQTKNTYEVFIYRSVPGKSYSSLVGYRLIKKSRN